MRGFFISLSLQRAVLHEVRPYTWLLWYVDSSGECVNTVGGKCSLKLFQCRKNRLLFYVPQCGMYIPHCGMYVPHCGMYIPQWGT